jgi:hypothetical protein
LNGSFRTRLIKSGALESPLTEECLIKNDFRPVVGHRFTFRATPMPHWNSVRIAKSSPSSQMSGFSYSFNASGEEAANGYLDSNAHHKGGSRAQEQSGFRPEDESNYQDASYGWQRFIAGLERVVAGLD